MTQIAYIGHNEHFSQLRNYLDSNEQLIHLKDGAHWIKQNQDKPFILLVHMHQESSDGISTLYELKDLLEPNYCMVIFMSEPIDDYLQVEVYKNGADEIITLPIGKRLFKHKLEVYKKRLRCCEDLLQDCGRGDLKFNREKYAVISSKGEITLSKREFEILSLLDSESGKVFTRQEIKERVWGSDDIHVRTIDVYIKKLRGVLGDSRIKTMNGIGYKLSK